MTREEILEIAKEAGWDCRFTRTTSERDFNSLPLEMDQIERFVEILTARISVQAGFSGSR